MCGIVGVVSADPIHREQTILDAMSSALKHRGPDEEGYRACGLAAFAARRLAIIDLASGQQPMANEDGTVMAVQNGEIYNYLELRDTLRQLGHAFLTRNDTEVIPHAYEEWGPRFVERLRGMFAIAVWDSKNDVLVMARDRFGKKPLLYAELPDGLAFASEIQALVRHPSICRTIDDAAIADYLTYGYIPAPRTAFRQIRKLPPAHVLVRSRSGMTLDRYWRLDFGEKRRISLEEAAAEVLRRLEEAVRIRMLSDVPLGAMLSGGLDSSAVVALMARQSGQPVRTFSVGFDDAAHDERRYARLVARTFGTQHEEIVVGAEHASAVFDLARNLGEPFADSSIVPTYQIARATRGFVTVALNGDGGDEVFGGYDRYRAAIISSRLPFALRGAAAVIARALPTSRSRGLLAKGRRFANGIGASEERRYLGWSGYFTGAWRERIFGERLRAFAAESKTAFLEAAHESHAIDPAERYIAADLELGLPGDLLVKMDIASMAASLETRSPMLDHEVAGYVATLPADLKVTAKATKIVLRAAMSGLLPQEILRRKKAGFMAPVGMWLRGPLREDLRDLALAPETAARGFVSRRGVERLYSEHIDGREDHTRQLWALLMLEIWFRECVDSPLGAPAEARRLVSRA